MNNTKVNECLLVSVEFTQGEDAGVLIVGRQKNGKVDIVNAFHGVSVEFTQGEDAGVLIVGRQKNGKVDIVNAFHGQEAIDIYKKLITVNKKEVNQ